MLILKYISNVPRRHKYQFGIIVLTVFLSLSFTHISVAEIPNADEIPAHQGDSQTAGVYDIAVYGGTPAGIIAAIQASEMGKKALIIEPGNRLGGAMSGGLGWSDIGNEATIGGLSREFFQKVYQYYQVDSVWKAESFSAYKSKLLGNHKIGRNGPMWTFEPHVAETIFRQMIDSAPTPIEVVYNERLDLQHGVLKKDGKIRGVRMESGHLYKAKIFIDASYQGDLMALAGVSYRVGRESRDTYHEPLAGVLGPTIKVRQPKQFFGPDVSPYDENGNLLPTIQNVPMGTPGQGDKKIQAYNFRVCLTTDSLNKLPIKKPANYDPLTYELLYRYIRAKQLKSITQMLTISPMPNLKTDINDGGHGCPFSTDYNGMNWNYPEGNYKTRSGIWQKHYDFTIGLFYFLGHDPRLPESIRREMLKYGLPKDEYAKSGHWTPQLYIRETRRMVGEYVLTQHDCQENITKAHSIGLASYGPDSHHVQRVVYHGEVINEGNFLEPHKSYEIPLGILLPKKSDCRNLLVPACVSASHIAFGSIRMEPVFMILGQSAATIASLAIDRNTCPQDLDYTIVREQLIKDHQLLKLKNNQ